MGDQATWLDSPSITTPLPSQLPRPRPRSSPDTDTDTAVPCYLRLLGPIPIVFRGRGRPIVMAGSQFHMEAPTSVVARMLSAIAQTGKGETPKPPNTPTRNTTPSGVLRHRTMPPTPARRASDQPSSRKTMPCSSQSVAPDPGRLVPPGRITPRSQAQAPA
ncbi:hypothetical protein BO71DRAFT_179569 [Aspergillus ellipticus CBS 707.79]|uniref:Uncharacterized protein n=1 Tax=Aspergillus ellipticus CBS 707.79 TaxID=1448320 RepID=A0A319D915_9EURO|nr:hypothetical protein BO71DRAFT_179569 [Aspergillus ellipticus CBS 707.79]